MKVTSKFKRHRELSVKYSPTNMQTLDQYTHTLGLYLSFPLDSCCVDRCWVISNTICLSCSLNYALIRGVAYGKGGPIYRGTTVLLYYCNTVGNSATATNISTF